MNYFYNTTAKTCIYISNHYIKIGCMTNVSFTEISALGEGYYFFSHAPSILVFLRCKQNVFFLLVTFDLLMAIFCISPRYGWPREHGRPQHTTLGSQKSLWSPCCHFLVLTSLAFPITSFSLRCKSILFPPQR